MDPVFVQTWKCEASDSHRKLNICCVTRSVGEADYSLGTNVKVKGLRSGNLCPLDAQALGAPAGLSPPSTMGLFPPGPGGNGSEGW